MKLFSESKHLLSTNVSAIGTGTVYLFAFENLFRRLLLWIVCVISVFWKFLTKVTYLCWWIDDVLCHQSEVECYWFTSVLYSKATLFWLFYLLWIICLILVLQLLLSKVTYLWQYELIMCFAISRKKQNGIGLRSFCILWEDWARVTRMIQVRVMVKMNSPYARYWDLQSWSMSPFIPLLIINFWWILCYNSAWSFFSALWIFSRNFLSLLSSLVQF